MPLIGSERGDLFEPHGQHSERVRGNSSCGAVEGFVGRWNLPRERPFFLLFRRTPKKHRKPIFQCSEENDIDCVGGFPAATVGHLTAN
jgi:hypothetical protein